jgi:hypothetical protein
MDYGAVLCVMVLAGAAFLAWVSFNEARHEDSRKKLHKQELKEVA